MIFNKITLTNFRQFKGTHSFEFSTGKSITLIIADNGVGKTTFLQAFRYCFYGESPNYLKLPNLQELLNNQIKFELKELDVADMSVEIEFAFQNTIYIVKREQELEKKNGVMKTKHSSFQMWEATKSGFKPKSDEDAEQSIRHMLPPGLAHIYMFDGERMEKRVESDEYKHDLKEAITGILGLKKLDLAVEMIGNRNKPSKIAGIIAKKRTTSSNYEQKLLDDYNEVLSEIETREESLKKTNDRIKSLRVKLGEYNEIQQKIKDHELYIIERDRINSNIKEVKSEIEKLATDNISNALKTLKHKLLLQVKPKYDEFMNKREDSGKFYQSLHIDTINDIIAKGVCICGTKIENGSEAFKHIKSHEDHVLPFENAHYLNRIADEFNSSTDFAESYNDLMEVKKNIAIKRSEYNNYEHELNTVVERIREIETKYDIISPQDQIDRIENDIKLNESEKIKIKYDLDKIEKVREKQEPAIKDLDKNSEYNLNIEEAINALDNISNYIQEQLKFQENHARITLEKHMNEVFSKTLTGKFDVKVTDDFSLEISKIVEVASEDKLKTVNQEHTNILSTGQSVMVSLSFIDSLLKTLDETRDVNGSDSHGIIMDAALSNVDEKHILKVCNNILNEMDQLIFLSFKKQLRHEFFYSIGKNVGKAYMLSLDLSGAIMKQEKSITDLDAFIHTIEKEQA